MPLNDTFIVRATAHTCKGYNPNAGFGPLGHHELMTVPDIQDVLMIVDQRLKLLGLSDREASLKATGKPDAIREMRRGKWPSDRRLRQIAGALETTLEHLLNAGPDYRGQYIQAHPASIIAQMDGVEGLPRDVAVYGASSMLLGQNISPHKISLRDPLRFACRPPVIRNRSDVFCVMMPDRSLHPRYDVGDELYVDPRRLPSPGDHVLVRYADDGDASSSEWRIHVRRLTAFTPDAIVLGTYDGAEPETLKPDAVWMMFRVFPWGELLAY